MSRAVRWTLALSCLAAAASGVLREAKVRTALHLQCREGQLISVESAVLLAGRQQQQQLASSTSSAAATSAAWNASLGQPEAVGGGAGAASLSSTTTPAAVESAEPQCQRAYLPRDEDYRLLVRRCSGYSSCSGIMSPSNHTMRPCGRQFGSDPDDYIEVNYICIDLSDVSDICDNVTRTLFRGYIRSPAYPKTVAALSSRVSSTGRLRCSCMLAAQNYAAIELLLQDVVVDSSVEWKLELAPTHGRPIVRLCVGNQTGSAAESAAGSSGCTNGRLPTSYSRLNVTFTLISQRGDTVGDHSWLFDRGRFLLGYSARELGRIVSTCQLLEGGSGSANDEHPETFTSASASTTSSATASSSGGIEQLPDVDWTTAAAAATAEDEQVSDDEESDSGLAIVVGVLVPALLLLTVLAAVGARVAWIYQRKKRWRNRSWSVLPSVCRRCCVQRSKRLSFAPIVGRAFDGVVYAMPGGASSKGCTQHTYDEAALASCPANCDDDHYDTIPGHHHYQDVEFGCRHYETLPDGSCSAASKRSSYACDDGGKPSNEAGAPVSLVALVTQVPSSSSSSSSSSASSSETSQPPIVGASTSTLYEVLGDCSAGAASPEPAHSDSCSVSVRSLGIDFSDVVAESLKRMSTPMFRSEMPLGSIAPCVDTDHAAQAQCEDYLSPICSHRDGSCCHVVAAKAAAVARVGSRRLPPPPPPDAAAVDESTREGGAC